MLDLHLPKSTSAHKKKTEEGRSPGGEPREVVSYSALKPFPLCGFLTLQFSDFCFRLLGELERFLFPIWSQAVGQSS